MSEPRRDRSTGSAADAPATAMSHGRLRRSRLGRSIAAFTAISLAVVMVAGVSLAAIAFWRIQSNVVANAVDIGDKGAKLPQIGDFKGGFNIMLVGVDNDPSQGSAYGKRDSTLNDVNILLHVSADHTSATAVSLPRDLIVPIPSCTSEDGKTKSSAMSARPINEAYYYGGLKCVTDTVSDLTGLDIPFAAVITFQGVIDMSDIVGGVEVCVDGPVHDKYTGLTFPAAGKYTIQGVQAQQFVRTRHGVGDGSDLGRISSQQVFMSGLARKLTSEGTLSDLGKLYQIAEGASEHMKLSTSLAQLDTMVSIAKAMRNIPLDRINFIQYPGDTGGTGLYAGKVQPNKYQAKLLFDALKADRPVQLDADSLDTGFDGSVADPDTPTTPGTTPPASTDPSAPASGAPSGDASDGPAILTGIKGQSAAQQTCSHANN